MREAEVLWITVFAWATQLARYALIDAFPRVERYVPGARTTEVWRIAGEVTVEVWCEPGHPDGELTWDPRVTTGTVLESTRTRFVLQSMATVS